MLVIDDRDVLRRIHLVGQKGLRFVPLDLKCRNHARRFGDPRTKTFNLCTRFVAFLISGTSSIECNEYVKHDYECGPGSVHKALVLLWLLQEIVALISSQICWLRHRKTVLSGIEPENQDGVAHQ